MDETDLMKRYDIAIEKKKKLLAEFQILDKELKDLESEFQAILETRRCKVIDIRSRSHAS